jgi:hypothetical protein
MGQRGCISRVVFAEDKAHGYSRRVARPRCRCPQGSWTSNHLAISVTFNPTISEWPIITSCRCLVGKMIRSSLTISTAPCLHHRHGRTYKSMATSNNVPLSISPNHHQCRLESTFSQGWPYVSARLHAHMSVRCRPMLKRFLMNR